MTTAKDILRTEYLTADKEETLTRVNSRIKDEAFSEVLVFDKEKLIDVVVGVFSPSRASMITPSKENIAHMKIGKLMKQIKPLDEDTELDEIMSKMLGTGYNIIPISKKGKVVGIVHIFDLLDAVKGKFDGIKVSDIELQKPVELFEDEKIGKAIQVLHTYINNTILVRDKDNNPVGILDHYDLLRNLKLDSYDEDRQNGRGYKSEKEKMLALPIYEFIKDKNFISVNSKDTILDVIENFKINNVTSLIVGDMSLLIRSEDILKNLEKSQMAKTRTIDFVGLDELKTDDFTIASIRNTAERSLEKIKDIIGQNANLKVHIKRHFANQENKRHKYSVVLHLEYPGDYFSIENVSEWDLKEAVSTAMKELESRINHVFKSKLAEARDSARSYSTRCIVG